MATNGPAHPEYHLLFDLDATLYPHTTGYEDFIISRIYEFMVSQLEVPRSIVKEQQMRIFKQFGQTLRGIRAPVETGGLGKTGFELQGYWDFIRGGKEEQARYLKRDPGVEKLIRELKGAGRAKLWVFTNADEKNAGIALDCIVGEEVAAMFDGVFGSFSFGEGVAKPAVQAFAKVFEGIGLTSPSDKVIMFEDSMENLKTAKKTLGLRTVWVTGGRHKMLIPGWHGIGAGENGTEANRELTREEMERIKEKHDFADEIVDLCDYETVKATMPELF
jgi:pyrimidine 5'-nucleotidase